MGRRQLAQSLRRPGGATLEQNGRLQRGDGPAPHAPGIVNGLGIMLVGPTLIHWGTEEQKQRFVPKILSAEEIWLPGFISEPGAGSDVASLNTPRSVEEGDTTFIVNGQKVWTSGADTAPIGASCWSAPILRRPSTRASATSSLDMHSPGVTVRSARPDDRPRRASTRSFSKDVKVAEEKNLVRREESGLAGSPVTTLMFRAQFHRRDGAI